jgi:SPASM domain peptide maturase of grasp-with-spasm system
MFQLFTSIKITEGYKRDLLLDLERETVQLIPKELTQFLKSLPTKTTFTDIEEQTVFELFKKEIIFECEVEQLDLFPTLSEEWDYPALITNAVVVISETTLHYLNYLCMELVNNGCFHVQFILDTPFKEKDLQKLLTIIKDSDLLGVGFILNFYSDVHYTHFLDSILTVTIVNDDIIVFNCMDEPLKAKHQQHFAFRNGLYHTNQCGTICKANFSISQSFYTESLHHNTCLNRKVTIDADGNIRNCPSLATTFGNVKTNSLKESVSKSAFQNVWHLKKEDIAVCKDCEFRTICTDCRAFTEEPNNLYSKPLKCGYNPYTNHWEEWSTHQMKQQAMEFYGLNV